MSAFPIRDVHRRRSVAFGGIPTEANPKPPNNVAGVAKTTGDKENLGSNSPSTTNTKKRRRVSFSNSDELLMYHLDETLRAAPPSSASTKNIKSLLTPKRKKTTQILQENEEFDFPGARPNLPPNSPVTENKEPEAQDEDFSASILGTDGDITLDSLLSKSSTIHPSINDSEARMVDEELDLIYKNDNSKPTTQRKSLRLSTRPSVGNVNIQSPFSDSHHESDMHTDTIGCGQILNARNEFDQWHSWDSNSNTEAIPQLIRRDSLSLMSARRLKSGKSRSSMRRLSSTSDSGGVMEITLSDVGKIIECVDDSIQSDSELTSGNPLESDSRSCTPPIPEIPHLAIPIETSTEQESFSRQADLFLRQPIQSTDGDNEEDNVTVSISNGSIASRKSVGMDMTSSDYAMIVMREILEENSRLTVEEAGPGGASEFAKKQAMQRESIMELTLSIPSRRQSVTQRGESVAMDESFTDVGEILASKQNEGVAAPQTQDTSDLLLNTPQINSALGRTSLQMEITQSNFGGILIESNDLKLEDKSHAFNASTQSQSERILHPLVSVDQQEKEEEKEEDMDISSSFPITIHLRRLSTLSVLPESQSEFSMSQSQPTSQPSTKIEAITESPLVKLQSDVATSIAIAEIKDSESAPTNVGPESNHTDLVQKSTISSMKVSRLIEGEDISITDVLGLSSSFPSKKVKLLDADIQSRLSLDPSLLPSLSQTALLDQKTEPTAQGNLQLPSGTNPIPSTLAFESADSPSNEVPLKQTETIHTAITLPIELHAETTREDGAKNLLTFPEAGTELAIDTATEEVVDEHKSMLSSNIFSEDEQSIGVDVEPSDNTAAFLAEDTKQLARARIEQDRAAFSVELGSALSSFVYTLKVPTSLNQIEEFPMKRALESAMTTGSQSAEVPQFESESEFSDDEDVIEMERQASLLEQSLNETHLQDIQTELEERQLEFEKHVLNQLRTPGIRGSLNSMSITNSTVKSFPNDNIRKRLSLLPHADAATPSGPIASHIRTFRRLSQLPISESTTARPTQASSMECDSMSLSQSLSTTMSSQVSATISSLMNMNLQRFLSCVGVTFLDKKSQRRQSVSGVGYNPNPLALRIPEPRSVVDRMTSVLRTNPEVEVLRSSLECIQDMVQESEKHIEFLQSKCQSDCQSKTGIHSLFSSAVTTHADTCKGDMNKLKKYSLLQSKAVLNNVAFGKHFEQLLYNALQEAHNEASSYLFQLEEQLEQTGNLGKIRDPQTPKPQSIHQGMNQKNQSEVASAKNRLEEENSKVEWLSCLLGWKLVSSNVTESSDIMIGQHLLTFDYRNVIDLKVTTSDGVVLEINLGISTDLPTRNEKNLFTSLSKGIDTSKWIGKPVEQCLTRINVEIGRIFDLASEIRLLSNKYFIGQTNCVESALLCPIRFSNAHTGIRFDVVFKIRSSYPFTDQLSIQLDSSFVDDESINTHRLTVIVEQELDRSTFKPLTRICSRLEALCSM